MNFKRRKLSLLSFTVGIFLAGLIRELIKTKKIHLTKKKKVKIVGRQKGHQMPKQ